MSDMNVQPGAEATIPAPGLSQMQRVTYTFTAPSKTFEDIKRGNKSWWLPLVVITIFTYMFFAAISFKVGWAQVTENVLQQDPKAMERMAQAPPEQKEMITKFTQYFIEGVFVATPLMAIVIALIGSLVLWGTANFVFGGKATYWPIVAVWFYAALPRLLVGLLGTIVLLLNSTPETFNLKAPAPTNIGAFLSAAETNKALYTLATWVDVTLIWMTALLGIGLAKVAGLKRSSGLIAAFGWLAIIVLITVAYAAITG
jgi:hypothetical protein